MKKRMLTYEEAEDFLRSYCEEKGYSYEKLMSPKRGWGESLGFGVSNGVKPNGLLNDLDTLPLITLVVRRDGEGFIAEETEYTKKYLV